MGDFFRQLPPILIVMFCGSSIALVAVLAVLVNARGKRARAASAAGAAAPPAASMSAPVTSAASFDLPDQGELPDLDDLLKVEAPARSANGTTTVQTSAGETVEVTEVLTVLRDVKEGGLLIRIGSQLHRNPPALADAEFKRRFNGTVRDLYQSISDTSLNKKATGEAPATVAAPEPEPVSAPAPAAPPTASTPAAAPAPAAAMPGDLPRFNLPDTMEKPKRGRKVPKEPIPEINIAEAIEEFLQYKLSSTPQFAGRSIHVRSAVGGGLRIDVDDLSYETVGEVADTEVRAFLQSAIDEWQSRQ
jgi:hypothetical protein